MLDDKLFPKRIVLLGSNSSFRKQRFFVIACNRKQPIGEESWNKEISSFSFLWQDKICLMRYSRQALFPPSTRATLKSFGDVFAKSCYQCRCK